MGEIIARRNYRPKHVELIVIINKIIIVGSSWLFILLYQWCMVTQTSNHQSVFFSQNRAEFSHPCKTAGKITVLYVVMYICVWGVLEKTRTQKALIVWSCVSSQIS